MSKRRSPGEGGIRLRKDGLWEGTVPLPNGRRKSVYDRVKSECLRKLTEIRNQISVGWIEPSKTTTSEFLDRWLQDSVRPRTRQSTFASYKATVDRYIRPALGLVELSKVTPMHAQGLLAELERQGKSPAMRRYVLVVLRMAFKQAAGWELIPKNPVTEAVKPPKVERRRRPVWTKVQADRFLEVASEDRRYALYVTALTTAMRQGEILGLQWSDVDLTAGVIRVVHNLVEDADRVPVLTDVPKTEAGYRTIPIAPKLRMALAQQREESMAAGMASNSYVFPASNGEPVRASNLVRAHQRLVQKAGLPYIRFHDLRHTAGTLLRASGLDLKVLQVLMGHSSFQVTADTYGHVLPDEQSKVVDAMAGVWGSKDGAK